MPESLRIGSLCSGYAGLEMGLAMVLPVETVWHVEYDAAPSRILEARFPGVPNHGDLTATDWTQVEPVDWLTAGYPCQPFSHAGKRKGTKDERHIWPDVARAIGVLRPGHVLLENVAGHLSLGFDTVLADLAALGYDARWGVVRAADAGAPHGRARLFVVASDASGQRHGGSALGTSTGRLGRVDSEDAGSARQRQRSRQEPGDRSGAVAADAERAGLQGLPFGCMGRPGESAARCAVAAADTDDGEPDIAAGADGTAYVGAAAGWGIVRTRGCVATDADGDGLESVRREQCGRRDTHGRRRQDIAWGVYEPAIRRWERILGRSAPAPTEPGRSGQRLSPRFVEWMQGLPDGWVTGVDISCNAQLKALGNGVVPQQAALAVRTLLALDLEYAA